LSIDCHWAWGGNIDNTNDEMGQLPAKVPTTPAWIRRQSQPVAGLEKSFGMGLR
jgi:hypothetical protein